MASRTIIRLIIKKYTVVRNAAKYIILYSGSRLGRKPIFWLSMMGNALTLAWTLAVLRFWKSIPVHAIFISPAFQIVGGGYNVISAVIFSMAADVESTENR